MFCPVALLSFPYATPHASAVTLHRSCAAIEFETVWRGLKGDLGAQAAYLRLLDPDTLPAVFKQSLTGPLLGSIVAALLTDLVCHKLQAVAPVRRHARKHVSA